MRAANLMVTDLHVNRTTGHHDVVMMSKEMKRAADAMMVNV